MHQRTNAPLPLSLVVTYRKRSRERERWKSRQSCRSTSFGYSGSAAERHSLDFLIRIGCTGLNTTRQNSYEFFLFDWGRRLLAHTQENSGLFGSKHQTRLVTLDLRDKHCTQGNCRLRCCENTRRWFEDCDLVVWVMCLCGRQVRLSIHRHSDAYTQCLRVELTAQWEEEARKGSGLAAAWNVRTKANIHLIWSDPEKALVLSNMRRERAFWSHFFSSTKQKL